MCENIRVPPIPEPQLFNHNEAAIEWQIGPSLINKQEWDTPMTTIFYHFLVPECGDPTWEEHFIEKGSFFKLNQQKEWDVV